MDRPESDVDTKASACRIEEERLRLEGVRSSL
jgi:hypothetical protein